MTARKDLTPDELTRLSVRKTVENVRTGAVKARAVAEAYLARIEAMDAQLGCFLKVTPANALAQADAVDAAVAQGQDVGPLAGVPLGVKDIFVTKGVETTCASRILEGFVPPYESTVTARLFAAGANMLGKVNMDEFAMGSSNENSGFFPARNPFNAAHVPGGSSGGSAAAVAARLCPASLGTDTGGSIRQPAALCGVTGLKPTYGRVSRYGVIAFASSLDHPGPFGRSVEDVAYLMSVMAGPDAKDATSLSEAPDDYVAAATTADAGALTGLRVGLPSEYFAEGLDAEVEAAVRAAVAEMEAKGAKVVPVSLPHTPYAVPTYYLICTAEASSNLARYDGIRFGKRGDGVNSLESQYALSRGQGFGSEPKRRIILGNYVLRSGFYDAYYGKAQRVRRLLANDFQKAFESVDVLVTPTTPKTAFRLGEKSSDPLSMYLADVYTVAPALAGLPALSLPCGLSSAGLPVGLQMIAPPLAETTLIRVGAAYQTISDHHRREPDWAALGSALTRLSEEGAK